ncbi:MAG: YfiR family protein [Verrucomicrobiota bacterium]
MKNRKTHLQSLRFWSRRMAFAAGCLSVGLGGGLLPPALAAPPLTELQVKALCLFNFAKYVEWPTNSFSNTNSPLLLVLQGDDAFTAAVQSSFKDKIINGRTIAIQVIHSGEVIPPCHILFVRSAENKRAPDILKRVNGLPVLTVGEEPPFTDAGGMISFVVRSGKVRFDINAAAARKAGLRISSNLLQLADTVSDKPR